MLVPHGKLYSIIIHRGLAEKVSVTFDKLYICKKTFLIVFVLQIITAIVGLKVKIINEEVG